MDTVLAAQNIHPIFIELICSLLCSSAFSILRFLDKLINFLRSSLDEVGSFAPIHYTNEFFLYELDVPNDMLVATHVVEIRARVATHIMRIVNFFSPNL